MNPGELFLLAVGLSMDAFAVAVGLGLTIPRTSHIKAVTVGLYFGFFQAVMPIIGFFAATHFAGYVTEFSHWIAFALLVLIGGKMIVNGFKKEEYQETNLSFRQMLPLAVATSIDAMAVGVSFALLNAEIFSSAAVIGAVTFVFSVTCVKIGGVFGDKFKVQAIFAGGIILILIGANILMGGLR